VLVSVALIVPPDIVILLPAEMVVPFATKICPDVPPTTLKAEPVTAPVAEMLPTTLTSLLLVILPPKLAVHLVPSDVGIAILTGFVVGAKELPV
jgi:hypothetical protein